jgi:6,7-dimethyl-8-ribityllumazine synthase
MTAASEVDLDGTGLKVGIAVASWNRSVTDPLLDGAQTRLQGMNVEEIPIVRVPGALELPLAARALAESGCDAVVAIGTIVKGDTDHYEIVVRESTAGIARVGLEQGVPITNAILAVTDFQDAMERAKPGPSNKGHEAAEAAVVTANALRHLREG